MEHKEKLGWSPVWTIRKYENDKAFEQNSPYDISEFKGNLLLNEGIAILLSLLIGGAGTAYSNANAYIGVGESATAAAASQTGLQGAALTYKAMESSYPSIASQTVTFRSVFGAGDANNAWNEFTVVNASTDTGDNLNRVVSTQGTKTAGQTWTVDVAITVS